MRTVSANGHGTVLDYSKLQINKYAEQITNYKGRTELFYSR